MDCRNQRSLIRLARIKDNGGSHTKVEWERVLANTPACAVCGRSWDQISKRPDTRYKYVWTKGHIIPIYHGGSDNISNIQAECYECNFRKNAGELKNKKPKLQRPSMAAKQDRFSKAFSFILKNGTEVFPVKMKRKETGAIAYRVSRGGTGGNTLASGEEVDEAMMIHKVVELGYAVRCSSLDGKTYGLYMLGKRSVHEMRRSST